LLGEKLFAAGIPSSEGVAQGFQQLLSNTGRDAIHMNSSSTLKMLPPSDENCLVIEEL
jgi:hypothetical protein